MGGGVFQGLLDVCHSGLIVCACADTLCLYYSCQLLVASTDLGRGLVTC
jgi:hypothetical protein